MDEGAVRRLLDAVRDGSMSPDDAIVELRRLPYADLGFARVDHHRALRQGRPEAVYGPGKAPAHCAAIVAELLDAGASPFLVTRAVDAQADAPLSAKPGVPLIGSTLV